MINCTTSKKTTFKNVNDYFYIFYI